MTENILNFNVGVLGHIDSGKTSLSKTLSTVASTASFDKNPQSQERGITIDLGFSSFSVDVPDHIKIQKPEYEILQFTLVDCPGHASLIKTIIGGAQIIDLIMLVIDITKGIQTQTAECLVLGEITCNHMIVILNKIDLLPKDKMEQSIQKMSKKILKTLEKTKFKDSVIVPVSAKPASEEKPIGIDFLIQTLQQFTYVPERSEKGQLMFAVDHCFAIRGQGTVMTGTVVQGCITLSDSIEIPAAKIVRKVKSIQMFKKPVPKAMQGDRVGICVTQFDPKTLERGIVCTPGYMETAETVIVSVHKIPYFKSKCLSNSKFHITIMHDTIMAKCTFFSSIKANQNKTENVNEFDFDKDYMYMDEIPGSESPENDDLGDIFALLQFDKPVIISQNSIYIASKLETDIHANVCRLAFHGKISVILNKKDNECLSKLRVYKEKFREGFVDRMVNDSQVIVRDLFKKETNIQIFTNLKVVLSTGEIGVIEGSFGKSGKINVQIPNGLSSDTSAILNVKKGKKETVKEKPESIKVILKFKKFIFDDKKKILQS
ncbi:selenocysteine-specific elongation factor [Trichonephila inaurata madagascariensis]|uniref:Selenocysteine-specific elongation factor n=1 Tax=Trichonephila inaurata madagascariensis TaxID=2747483 RepID=A0A8X7CFU7_9ARAC|nr:selenocysteine-specific elongation factor [Trichonephila inaurata madagascariensis]